MLIYICSVISEVIIIDTKKKMGRPTDNPKDTSIRFRVDSDTVAKLSECSEKLKMSKSEVLRLGVKKVHDDLKK